MKKILLSIIGIIASVSMFAQAPNAFNYQAVARASNGDLITDQKVSFQISILQGSVSGSSVYTEEHVDTTNAYGLVKLEIGNGTTGDDFTAINWANGPYFVKVEMDVTGGTTYAEMGTSQLLSVPFAKYADKAGNVFSGNYTDLINTPKELPTSVSKGDLVYYDGTAWTKIEQPTDVNYYYTLLYDAKKKEFTWSQSDLNIPTINFNGTLYVHTEDNSTGIQWYNGSYITTNATSTTDGVANTDSIVKYQGAGAYAAYLCDTLTAFGHNDWYLPAKDELNAMYQNKATIGGFSSNAYWSSTENANTSAWAQDFGGGNQDYDVKYGLYRVRCVRRD